MQDGYGDMPADAGAMREMLTVVGLVRVALARRLDMSLLDLEIMEQLLLAPAGTGLGPGELGRRLGVTSAAATQAVTRLHRAGHVERRPHPGDRRRLTLEATPTGREHVMAALGPMLDLVTTASADLTQTERSTVTRHLQGQTRAYRAFLEHLAAEQEPGGRTGDDHG